MKGVDPRVFFLWPSYSKCICKSSWNFTDQFTANHRCHHTRILRTVSILVYLQSQLIHSFKIFHKHHHTKLHNCATVPERVVTFNVVYVPSNSSSSSVTSQALTDLFQPCLIVSSKVLQVVFVHLAKEYPCPEAKCWQPRHLTA